MQYSHRQVFLKENLSKEACSEHRTLYVRQPIQLPTSCHRTGNVEIVGNVKKKKKKKSGGSSDSGEKALIFLSPTVFGGTWEFRACTFRVRT